VLAVVFVSSATAVVFAVGRTDTHVNPAAASRQTLNQYLAAWSRGDLHGMYRLISPQARATHSFASFASSYHAESSAAGLVKVTAVSRPRGLGPVEHVIVKLKTRLFGTPTVNWRVPMVEAPGGYRVDWTAPLAWPGLRKGERLERKVLVPKRRGIIFARDKTALAEGPAVHRVYPQGAPFSHLTGFMQGPQTATAIAARQKIGWPASTPYGQGGLEQSLDPILAGVPTIQLVAVRHGQPRVIQTHPGRKPEDVVTTLDPTLQADVVNLLGNREGGIVVLDPSTGGLLADAGLGMDTLQPPGSSFKTITGSAALTAGLVNLNTTYPYERFVDIDGWKLRNFHFEECGGTLVQAFANSCNSVYAPIADQVGAKRLVAMANAFGFNQKPTIAYPVPTSIAPGPQSISSPLQIGIAGIGQGGVDASPLQMASVASVISEDGILRPPYLIEKPADQSDHKPSKRVISPTVAGDMTTMMEAVVSYGTGTSAAISGVTVAGKTGTAEVGGKGTKSDAWFICFAPVGAPKVAVAVMLVHGGVGGKEAAPLAGQVLAAALG
jgi:cell division protein FtsI/penicillin-binding protein 2